MKRSLLMDTRFLFGLETRRADNTDYCTDTMIQRNGYIQAVSCGDILVEETLLVEVDEAKTHLDGNVNQVPCEQLHALARPAAAAQQVPGRRVFGFGHDSQLQFVY